MRVRSLAFALALGFNAPALADDHSPSVLPPSVSVVGEAQAEVPPDMAILTLSISVERSTATDAAAENARIAKTVIEGLKSAGVAAQDIQTVGLSIYPEFTNSGSQKRSVTGYHANDAYSAYLEMGSPQQLTGQQLNQLNELTRDTPEIVESLHAQNDGSLQVDVPMRSNDIVLVTVQPARNPK